MRATLHRFRSEPGYQPIPIKQDVTADEQAFIAAHRNELPELETIDEERRLYPRDGFAAHLIGYVGEVSEDDLNNPRFAYYEPGDVVGKAGVEETYDELLRGQDGSREVVVDSRGREVGYFGIQHAMPGQDLKLTIDNDLAARRRTRHGRPQRRHCRHGPAQRRDPGDGLAAQLRSERICRQDRPRGLEQAGHRSRPSADEQGHPGTACARLDIQDSDVGGGASGGHRAEHAHRLQRAAGDRTVTTTIATSITGAVDIYNAIPYSCDTFFYMLGDKLGIDES